MTSYVFDTVVEADLCKEEVLYSGASAAKSIEVAHMAGKVLSLFDLEGIVKVRRHRGGRSVNHTHLMLRYAYKNGQKVDDFIAPTEGWLG
jgi:hypothetical protein